MARTFPAARVHGLDLAPAMIRVGDAKLRAHPVVFLAGDAASLPVADACFDLVVTVAAPVFASEFERVLAQAGTVILTFPLGEETPIYLPQHELERLLRAAGLEGIEHGKAGRGTFSIAQRM